MTIRQENERPSGERQGGAMSEQLLREAIAKAQRTRVALSEVFGIGEQAADAILAALQDAFRTHGETEKESDAPEATETDIWRDIHVRFRRAHYG